MVVAAVVVRDLEPQEATDQANEGLELFDAGVGDTSVAEGTALSHEASLGLTGMRRFLSGRWSRVGCVSRQPRTLAEHAAANLQASGMGQIKSVVKAAQACSHVWALAICAHKLGRWPTQTEYAEWWKITDRSVQREWALVRQAFPGEESPERLARWVLSEVSSRIEEPSSALSVPMPASVAFA